MIIPYHGNPFGSGLFWFELIQVMAIQPREESWTVGFADWRTEIKSCRRLSYDMVEK